MEKKEFDKKERRQGKKNPGQSSSYQHQNKKIRGPQGSNQPTLQRPTQTIDSKTILLAPSIASLFVANAVEVRDLVLRIKNIYKPKPPTVVA